MASKANLKLNSSYTSRLKHMLFIICRLFVMPLGACAIYAVINLFDSHQHPALRMWMLIVSFIGTIMALALNNKETKQITG